MDGNSSSWRNKMKIRKVTDEERKLLFPPFIKEIEDPPRHITGNILKEYFALENEQICGWAFLRTLETPHRFSIGFFVLPKERGKGLAQKIVTILLQESDKEKIEIIFASTRVENTLSQRILEKNGFKRLGEANIDKKKVYRYQRRLEKNGE
jgi:predicted acetyltransferase